MCVGFERFKILALIFFLLKCVPGQELCSNELADRAKTPCVGEAYLGLCGVCVGGSSGLPPTYGLDLCGICGGSNLCVGCDKQVNSGLVADACGKCLKPIDERWNDCKIISSASPSILDKAVTVDSTISLRGAGIDPTEITGIKCALPPLDGQGGEAMLVENQLVEDGVIQLKVAVKTVQPGRFAIRCETGQGGSLLVTDGVQLVVVDSKTLSVSATNVQKIAVGQTVQVELTVPNLKDGVEVFCFAHDQNKDVTYLLRNFAVADKQVSFNYTAKKAKIIEFGVAYTVDAAFDRESNGGVVEITVTADAPVLKEAVFSDDLTEVRIGFDRNIAAPSDCAGLFSPPTLALLGEGAVCGSIADKLLIKLGSNPKIQPSSQIELSSNSQIYSELSDPKLATQAKGTIALVLAGALKTAKPTYSFVVPKYICLHSEKSAQSQAESMRLMTADGEGNATKNSQLGNGVDQQRDNLLAWRAGGGGDAQTIRLTPGGQNLNYDWSVSFNGVDTSSPDRTQRDNVLVWRSVRGLKRYLNDPRSRKMPDVIRIDNNMLAPGVTYQVGVSAVNMLGVRGPENSFTMTVFDDTPQVSRSPGKDQATVGLTLAGAETTYANVDFYVLAKVTDCFLGGKQTFNYEWSVVGPGFNANLALQRGQTLRVPALSFQGGQTYEVTCTVTSKIPADTAIRQKGTLTVRVLTRGLQALVAPNYITLGTNRGLQLDASKSYDPDNHPGLLVYQWCCIQKSGDSCLFPSPGEPLTLVKKFRDEFQKAILKLPAGAMPIGEYIFTVQVSKPNTPPSTEAVSVSVVQGSPPVLSVTPSANLLWTNPATGLNVQGSVVGARRGCTVWWEVAQEKGFQYFDLSAALGLGDDIVLGLEDDVGTVNDLEESDVPLVIPGPTGSWPGLQGNAAFKLRLSSFCSRQVTGGAPIESHSDVILRSDGTPVAKPLQVAPLEGEGLKTWFRFSTQPAYDNVNDYPLVYHFGFQVDQDEDPVFFSASSEELQAGTLLPAERRQNVVTPVLKVCDSRRVCSVTRGQNITTRRAAELTAGDVGKVFLQIEELMNAQQYTVSTSLARYLVQTLKPSQKDMFDSASKQIETRMRAEVTKLKDNLDTNPTALETSLDFLKLAILTMKELPTSDTRVKDLEEMAALRDKIMNILNNSKPRYMEFAPRTRRDASEGESKETKFTPTIVTNLLQVLESQISVTTDKSSALKWKKQLLDEVNTYVISLCQGAAMESKRPVSIGWYRESEDLPIGQTSLSTLIWLQHGCSSVAGVNLGGELMEKNGQKEACIGTALFQSDPLTEVFAKPEDVAAGKRHSSVFEVQLVNLESKEFVKTVLERVSLMLKLPVTETTVAAGSHLQCVMWKANSWSQEGCRTLTMVKAGNKNLLHCKCTSLGYFTVVAVVRPEVAVENATVAAREPLTKKTTVPSIFEVEIITTPKRTTTMKPRKGSTSRVIYNVSFRIDEDFATIVGSNQKKVETNLRQQIINQVQMPEKMITKLELLPGSLVVAMRMMDTEFKTAEEMIAVIAQILSQGRLVLYDLKDRKMSIPPQKITVMQPYQDDKDNVIKYAVISCVLIIIALIVSMVTAAAIIKHKREMDHRRKMQMEAQGNIPTYQQFHSEEIIEGTSAALARYRSNQPVLGTVSNLHHFENTDNRTGQAPKLVGGRWKMPTLPNRAGSSSKLVAQEEIPMKTANPTAGGAVSQQVPTQWKDRHAHKQNLNSSTVSFDVLPGTPTDDYH